MINEGKRLKIILVFIALFKIEFNFILAKKFPIFSNKIKKKKPMNVIITLFISSFFTTWIKVFTISDKRIGLKSEHRQNNFFRFSFLWTRQYSGSNENVNLEAPFNSKISLSSPLTSDSLSIYRNTLNRNLWIRLYVKADYWAICVIQGNPVDKTNKKKKKKV